MKTIYVGCLAQKFTGGLTLAHQLCYELVKQGYDAKMYYYYGFSQKKEDPVNENYKKYNLNYVTKIKDSYDNVLVAPESNVNILRRVKKCKKMIWWMSVDNYYRTLSSKRYKIEDLFGLRRYNIFDNDILHLAQSYYAIDFLKKNGVSEDRIQYLSDYIDSEFLDNSKIYIDAKKEDVALYNPKKGWNFTKLILEKTPNINWIPLVNLTPSEMKIKLGTSKVYIDFGNHPGKDRIPREAAIMGCCVITGRRGSANFYQDVMIPDSYKFSEDLYALDDIASLINSCITDYSSHRKNFAKYIEFIKSEKESFAHDVNSVFSKL